MGRIKKCLLGMVCCLPLWALAQTDELDVVADSMQQEETMENIRRENGADTPKVAVKAFAFDSVQAWRGDPEFGYMRYADSVLRSRYQTIPDDVEPPKQDTTSWNLRWVRWIWWILAAAALLFVLYRLAAQAGFVRRNTQRKPDNTAAQQEPAEGDAHPAQLEAAIQRGDYRLAVRLQFLLLLQQLRAQKLITDAPGKTNRQYLYDLQDAAMRQDLAAIMLPYEYVWYGSFVLQPQQFQQIREQYLKFQSQWLAA